MKKPWLLLTLVLTASCLAAVGCTTPTKGTISGLVLFYVSSDVPANGVTVHVDGPVTTNATSNSAGEYEISSLEPGTYVVTADFATSDSMPGFVPGGGIVNDVSTAPVGMTLSANTVEVTAGQTASVDFKLVGSVPE